jgi:ribosomal protein S27AE
MTETENGKGKVTSAKVNCPCCGGEGEWAVRCANNPPSGQCLNDDGTAAIFIGYPIEALRAERLAALELPEIRALIDSRSCPNCPDQGWFMTGACERVQCEWCETNQDSKFIAISAFQKLKDRLKEGSK